MLMYITNNFKNKLTTSLIKLLGLLLLIPITNVAAAECPTTFQGQQTTLTCTCSGPPPAGTVWGTKVYTDDSIICQAAVHAGKRGWFDTSNVTVNPLPRRSFYYGTWAYGVFSYNYPHSWSGSFSFDEVNYFSDHLNHLQGRMSNYSSDSVTFFAGGDPQFGYTPSGLSWQDAVSAADATMNYVAKLANDCSYYSPGCAPAFAIAGDLLMDSYPNMYYLSGSKDNYNSVISSINYTNSVVLDGLGNHDTAQIENATFFDMTTSSYKPTGYFSRYYQWNVLDQQASRSCWKNGAYVRPNSSLTSADAYYCKTGDLNYYTVGIKNEKYTAINQQNAKAYIIQLHAGSDDSYAMDQKAIDYLSHVISQINSGQLSSNIPIFLVAHMFPNVDQQLANKISQLNIAGIIVGHAHKDISAPSSEWFNFKWYYNKHNKAIPVTNTSALMYDVFASFTVDGSTVEVNRFDRKKSNSNIQTVSYTYK